MQDDKTAVQSPLLLPIGYRLEEFEILRVLGQGGFGTVYLARDHRLNQLRAIKEYEPGEIAVRVSGYSNQPKNSENFADSYREGLKNFINEAQLLASIDHPNIVRVYRCIEANNTAYIVMHYCEGETLEAWSVRQAGRAPEPQWVQHLLVQLLDGLQVVHAKGILHRDIKPSNIYLIDGYRPVLIDFGAARRVVSGSDTSLTSIITVGFSPIEQYGDASDANIRQGPWTDIYALGATLYKLITGSKPPEPHLLIMNGRTLSTAKSSATRYPRLFLQSLDKALGVKPADRFQSAAEWRNALGGLPGIPWSAAATMRQLMANPWLHRLAGVLILAGAAFGGYSWNTWQRNQDKPLDQAGAPARLQSANELVPKPVAAQASAEPVSMPVADVTPKAQMRYALGQSFRDCDECPELVVIPSGAFTMGSPVSEQRRQNDEGPLHRVMFAEPFALGKFEVTREDWRRFARAEGYRAEGCDEWRDGGWRRNAALNWENPGFAQEENEPATCLTWEDATNYVKWLAAKTGQPYRLPSEAEWEYAARAGAIDAHYWGNTDKAMCAYANGSGKGCDDRQAKTSAVGGFRPNAFGLYDMLGVGAGRKLTNRTG